MLNGCAYTFAAVFAPTTVPSPTLSWPPGVRFLALRHSGSAPPATSARHACACPTPRIHDSIACSSSGYVGCCNRCECSKKMCIEDKTRVQSPHAPLHGQSWQLRAVHCLQFCWWRWRAGPGPEGQRPAPRDRPQPPCVDRGRWAPGVCRRAQARAPTSCLFYQLLSCEQRQIFGTPSCTPPLPLTCVAHCCPLHQGLPALPRRPGWCVPAAHRLPGPYPAAAPHGRMPHVLLHYCMRCIRAHPLPSLLGRGGDNGQGKRRQSLAVAGATPSTEGKSGQPCC